VSVLWVILRILCMISWISQKWLKLMCFNIQTLYLVERLCQVTNCHCYIYIYIYICGLEFVQRPPLWSSGCSSWLLTQRSWVRFPALPNFLHSKGSVTGSTQPREGKWGATWKKSSASGLEKWDQRPWEILRADHVTPLYPQKLGIKFADKWRSLSRYSSLVD
jgi:hypothetical protein